MRNGPEIWQAVIDKVTPAFGPCIVAGGAVRDYVINKNIRPRDVDVFVAAETGLDMEFGLDNLDDPEFFELGQNYGPGGGDPNIVGQVIDGTMEIGDARVRVNVIGRLPNAFADFETSVVGLFPHSLCQAWYDGREVCFSDAFKATLETKVVTLVNDSTKVRLKVAGLLGRGKSYEEFKLPPSKTTKKSTYDPESVTFDTTGATYYVSNDLQNAVDVNRLFIRNPIPAMWGNIPR